MSDRTIKEAINKLTGQHKIDQVTYVNAVVNSVDIPNRVCDCTVIEGKVEFELPTVKLMAVIDDGLLIEPTVGSNIKILFSVLIEPFVVQFSEIENIWINAVSKINFNNGTNTTAKADTLHTELNKAKKRVDDLISAINSCVPAVSETGLTALKVSVAAIVNAEDYSQIENTDILHGNA